MNDSSMVARFAGRPSRAQSAKAATGQDPFPVEGSSHRLLLLPGSRRILEVILRDVARARRRVWIETYILRDDRLGRRLADALAGARARGVDVRVLYDALGSKETGSAFFADLREAGIDARPYRPLSVSLLSGAPLLRDHARVLVIDGHGYTGGAAWGDEWLPASEGGEGWHDVCVQAAGPCVEDLALAFLRRFGEADDLEVSHDASERDVTRRYADLDVVIDSTGRPYRIHEAYLKAIEGARARVWIENSYFFPPRRMRSALFGAAARGVDVRVIVPKHTDLPSVRWAARGEYERWLRGGIRVHEYVPTVAHSKFALVDDDWAAVGTFNANVASLRWANEVSLFVRERAFVAQVADLFERDLASSERVNPGSTQKDGVFGRARNWLASRVFRLLEPRGL